MKSNYYHGGIASNTLLYRKKKPEVHCMKCADDMFKLVEEGLCFIHH